MRAIGLEDRVDERADRGRLAEDHEDPEHEQHDHQRDHPEDLPLPEEAEEIPGDADAREGVSEEADDGFHGGGAPTAAGGGDGLKMDDEYACGRTRASTVTRIRGAPAAAVI